MKLNVKRTMGISALALAMMMNVGAAALAADDSEKSMTMTPADTTLAAPAGELVDCEVASMKSVDCNVTSIEGEEGKQEFVIQDADGTEYLLRFDEETGEASRSKDGGKTWEPYDASVPMTVQPIDGADGEYSVSVSFKEK